MAKSLRDQLVEAGLASASQAKKAEKQKRSESQAQRKQGAAAAKGGSKGAGKQGGKARPPAKPQSESAQKAQKARAAKAQRDRELAAERNAKAAAKALRAEIKQLVTQHDQREKGTREDDVPYNFLHGKKIKRIYVPAKQQEQLSSGQLAIINNDGRYHLVTKDIAAKISERDPKWVVAAHDPSAKVEEEMDDYYKDFQVPDDLDW